MNDARYRTMERLFKVPREQANHATLIALGTPAHAVHDRSERLLRGPGGPTRTDAFLGIGVLREFVYRVSGPSSRGTPLLGTLGTLTVLGRLAGPALRRSIRSVEAGGHRLHVMFDHRYRHLIRGSRRR